MLEIISGDRTAAELCREYNLKPILVSRWKNQFLSNAAQVFETDKELDPQLSRIEELERLAGKLSLELEITHLSLRTVQGKKALTLLPRARAGNGN